MEGNYLNLYLLLYGTNIKSLIIFNNQYYIIKNILYILNTNIIFKQIFKQNL